MMWKGCFEVEWKVGRRGVSCSWVGKRRGGRSGDGK